jgi:hypothetical protein
LAGDLLYGTDALALKRGRSTDRVSNTLSTREAQAGLAVRNKRQVTTSSNAAHFYIKASFGDPPDADFGKVM